MTKRPQTAQASSAPMRPRLARSQSDSNPNLRDLDSTMPVLAPPPIPISVPIPSRPPRNPARVTRTVRPSTATGAPEDVTPWELYPAPDFPDAPMASVRISTRSSSNGLHFSDLAIVRRRKSTGAKPHPKNASLIAAQPLSTRAQTSPKMIFKAAALAPAALSPYVPSNALPTPQTRDTAQPAAKPILLAGEPKKEPDSSHLKFSTADRTILEELKRNISARAAQFIFKGGPQDNGAGWGAQGIGAGKKHHPFPKDEVPYPRNYERDVLDLDVWENAFYQQISGSLTYHVFDHPPARVLDLGCGTGTWILDCARAWRHSTFVGLDIVPLHPDLQQVGSIDLAARITWVQANFLEGLPFPNEEFDFVHAKRISLGVPEDKWDALFEEITRVMKPGAAFEMIEEDLFFPGKSPDDEDDSVVESEAPSSRALSRTKLHRQSLPSSAFDNFARILERTNHDRDRDSDSLTGSNSGGSRRTSSIISGRHSDELVWSPTTSGTTISSAAVAHAPSQPPVTPPRSSSPLPPAATVDSIAEDVEGEKLETVLTSPVHSEPKSLPKSPSAINLRERIVPAALRLPPPPHLSHARPTLRTSAVHPVSRLPPQGKFASAAEWMMDSLSSPTYRKPTLPVRTQIEVKTSQAAKSASTLVGSQQSPIASSASASASAISATKKTPLVLRPLPRHPSNPRDHSLLALIYSEMCESRFINLSPLSLLANLLGLHFHDVRTHPPLQFTFPPRAKSITITSSDNSETSSDPDETHDAIIPHPLTPDAAATPRANTLNASSYFTIPADDGVEEESRFLSVRGLIKGASQYVTLDDSRVSAFSPSKKAGFPSPTTNTFFSSANIPSAPSAEGLSSSGNGSIPGSIKARAISMRNNRLPNATLNIDLRTLNLHLAIRTSEILACSESMWEWVVDHQRQLRAQKMEPGASKGIQRARSGSVETALHQRRHTPEPPSLEGAIAELTREDFDGLLRRFSIDMREQMSLGPALQERFSWYVVPSSPTTERKMFDNEYAQWIQWEQEKQEKQERQPAPRRPMSMVGSSSSLTVDTEKQRRSSDASRTSGGGRTLKRASSAKGSSSSSSSAVTSPTRKLSRAMRVFVGWKPIAGPDIV